MDAKTALSKRENFQELLDTVKEDFKPMRQKLKEKTFLWSAINFVIILLFTIHLI